MTRSLRSYPEHQRKAVVERRLAKHSGGLGYLAALDYSAAVKRERAARAKKKK